ncbi:MAG TPA: GDSL-type esterase/lipase family protein [Vicinamibacterales bacterium]
MTLSRRKKIVFALLTMALSVVAALIVLLVADLIVHRRAERSAGLNRWGYRGPVAGSKRDGELRAVMLGGSTVFGYGVQWDQSLPVLLEQQLNASRPFSVVNLGFNNEGAYSFAPTLRDYEYLDYDIVVLYEGYNDMPGDEGPNTSVFRHNSAVFRLTGYFPILPLYLDEKAMMLRYGGDLGAAYAADRGETPKTVFRPNVAARTSAAALDGVAKATNALGEQLGRLSKIEQPEYARVSRIGCSFPWINYCDSVHTAVRLALSKGKRVLVVGQPRMSGTVTEAHARQQHMLGTMIRTEFASEPRVAYVDLGNAVSLADPNYTFDAMHLNADGNRKVAEALAPHVLAIAAK